MQIVLHMLWMLMASVTRYVVSYQLCSNLLIHIYSITKTVRPFSSTITG